MPVQSAYAVRVAPYAVTQIDAALDGWERNRPGAQKLLAQELEAALRLIEHAPQAGREHEVWVVHFRHARRRPISGSS